MDSWIFILYSESQPNIKSLILFLKLFQLCPLRVFFSWLLCPFDMHASTYTSLRTYFLVPQGGPAHLLYSILPAPVLESAVSPRSTVALCDVIKNPNLGDEFANCQ